MSRAEVPSKNITIGRGVPGRDGFWAEMSGTDFGCVLVFHTDSVAGRT